MKIVFCFFVMRIVSGLRYIIKRIKNDPCGFVDVKRVFPVLMRPKGAKHIVFDHFSKANDRAQRGTNFMREVRTRSRCVFGIFALLSMTSSDMMLDERSSAQYISY